MLALVISSILIALIAFLLAWRSMHNYQERPEHFKLRYSLYLIQKPQFMNSQFFAHLHQLLGRSQALVVFEGLLKGSRQALVVYGPRQFFQPLTEHLGLLELEDYSLKVPVENLSLWQQQAPPPADFQPDLKEHEQLWYQLVLQPQGDHYQANARVAAISTDPSRRENLKRQFKPLPQQQPSAEALKLYQQRVFEPQGENVFSVKPSDTVVFFDLFVGHRLS